MKDGLLQQQEFGFDQIERDVRLDGSLQRAFPLTAVLSSNGKKTQERNDLYRRFCDRMLVDVGLNRKLVSYQGNKHEPGFRWFKYKEGFSRSLVRTLLPQQQGTHVLDPFSGVGTTVVAATGLGHVGTGIEIMPVGNLAAMAVAYASNGIDMGCLEKQAKALVQYSVHGTGNRMEQMPITQGAYPRKTESALMRAQMFISKIDDPAIATVLTLACVSILEDVSYTRKDGQFLRWDPQSGRVVSPKLDKGPLPTVREALGKRMSEIIADIPILERTYAGHIPTLVNGSSLNELKKLQANSVDAVVTSPPYANRYDYTRTYALELEYLGYGHEQLKALRQSLLSATVENGSKRTSIEKDYGEDSLAREAFRMADEQPALQEILDNLTEQAHELSNRNVIRLVKNYFTEMAVVVRELGRVVRPGGSVFMVNDNVRYHGEEVPVDLILSDFAEQSGFRCQTIRMLERGKGNSSQQMGRFGRHEIRKCVYHWEKPDG